MPLVGKWHTEGAQLEGPLGPAAPFVAVETFEWLDGGRFLIHRMDGRFGRQPAACVEVWGKEEGGNLTAHAYYNDGNTNTWNLDSVGDTLVLRGSWGQSPASTFQVRCTLSFTEAGNTLVGKWEQSRDGRAWKVFLETRSTKAQPLPNTSIGI